MRNRSGQGSAGQELTAPIITCDRHRIQSDGQGVTTLVCFYGCPLKCRWCINGFTQNPDTQRSNMTPGQLYEKVKCDDLYFRATGGGVTFGGGEPLLYPTFVRQFRGICPGEWRINLETSLNVPLDSLRETVDAVDMYIIDCKDTNGQIYRNYTGCENAQMLANLRWLLQRVPAERILVRIPLIPDLNTPEDQQKSKALLEAMGVSQVELFSYQKLRQDHW